MRTTTPPFSYLPNNSITTKTKLMFNPYFSNNQKLSVVRRSNYITPYQLKVTKKIQIQNGYQCSILDFGAQVQLISEVEMFQFQNEHGKFKKIRETVICSFKPILLDQDMKAMNNVSLKVFKTSIILNKTEKYMGECRVLRKKESNYLILFFILQGGRSFNIEYSIETLKQNFLQYINIDPCQQNLLKISLQDNKSKFMEFLSALKINCHFGNWLKLYFKNQLQVNLFLYDVLEKTNNPITKLIKQKLIQINPEDHLQHYKQHQICYSPTNDSPPSYLTSSREIPKGMKFDPSDFSEHFQQKIKQIQQSYKKMEQENNKLKFQNFKLKQKISKNTSVYDQKQKIKDIQNNLKRMTNRIQILEEDKKIKTKVHQDKFRKNEKMIKGFKKANQINRPGSSSSQPEGLFVKKAKQMRMIPQNCQKTRPLDESKFAQNIKIMSPTPKYFRSELNTHHDQILHSPNQKAFERNINFNKNGKSPGFTTVNNFSNKIM